MYQRLWILLIIAFIANCQANSPTLGAKVYEFAVQNEEQFNKLLPLQKEPGYDFWQIFKHSGQKTRVMVSRETQDEFENILAQISINYEITISDVEKMLQADSSINLARSSASSRLTFNAYHRYEKIVEYLKNLTYEYPKNAKLETVGLSFEKRNLYALRISNGSSNSSKLQIFIDGGIHAREWIAPAVALYVVHQLLENKSSNKDLLDLADWLILPVVNPDGYEYTHTTDRLWRKTRSIFHNSSCIGVDGNRNYGYEWGGEGSSFDPCSIVYSGPEPFSESETRAVRDLLLNEKNTKIYLTLHSYGNLLLYPWGYTTGLPQDWARLQKLGQDAAFAIEHVNGTKYTVGSSALALGMSAGSSRDFARGAAHIPTPYTVELPAGGPSGFELPPDQILPAATEIFEGIRNLVQHINE